MTPERAHALWRHLKGGLRGPLEVRDGAAWLHPGDLPGDQAPDPTFSGAADYARPTVSISAVTFRAHELTGLVDLHLRGIRVYDIVCDDQWPVERIVVKLH